MGYSFDADTTPGPDGYRLGHRWSVMGTPNGGYLQALAVRASAEAAAHPHPLAVSSHYLRRSQPGPASVELQRLGAGRTTSTVASALVQEGTIRVHTVTTFGELGGGEGDDAIADRHVTRRPPELAPPDRCPPMRDRPSAPEIFGDVDLRLDPELAIAGGGVPSGAEPLEVKGWVRFADGRPIDVWSLLLFADGFPPAVFELVPRSWVPTLELTVHVRALPRPGEQRWLRGVFRTSALADGHLEEDGELWDDDGRLLAMSRQLARYRRPPAATSPQP